MLQLRLLMNIIFLKCVLIYKFTINSIVIPSGALHSYYCTSIPDEERPKVPSPDALPTQTAPPDHPGGEQRELH